MNVNIVELSRENLRDFADKHNLSVTVKERSHIDSPTRFYASFDNVEVKDGGMLRGTYGNGATPDESISNYAKEISSKTLVFGAYTGSRREINAPILSF